MATALSARRRGRRRYRARVPRPGRSGRCCSRPEWCRPPTGTAPLGCRPAAAPPRRAAAVAGTAGTPPSNRLASGARRTKCSYRNAPNRIGVSAGRDGGGADQYGNLAPVLFGELDGGVGCAGCVDERHEPGQLVRVVEDGFPFAGVAGDVPLDRSLELRGQAHRVVDDDLAQMVEAAVETFDPRRGALQAVRGADVVDEEAVDVANEGFAVEVGGQ